MLYIIYTISTTCPGCFDYRESTTECVFITSYTENHQCPRFVNYKKGAAACDKVYQLLDHGRWFSPGTPASSTTETGGHDIVEILLKMALNTINQIK
jgi:hypothetical protein